MTTWASRSGGKLQLKQRWRRTHDFPLERLLHNAQSQRAFSASKKQAKAEVSIFLIYDKQVKLHGTHRGFESIRATRLAVETSKLKCHTKWNAPPPRENSTFYLVMNAAANRYQLSEERTTLLTEKNLLSVFKCEALHTVKFLAISNRNGYITNPLANKRKEAACLKPEWQK